MIKDGSFLIWRKEIMCFFGLEIFVSLKLFKFNMLYIVSNLLFGLFKDCWWKI